MLHRWSACIVLVLRWRTVFSLRQFIGFASCNAFVIAVVGKQNLSCRRIHFEQLVVNSRLQNEMKKQMALNPRDRIY